MVVASWLTRVRFASVLESALVPDAAHKMIEVTTKGGSAISKTSFTVNEAVNEAIDRAAEVTRSSATIGRKVELAR